MAERPTIDQYFMDMTHLVKARGTCPRRTVGAVVVKDKRVLTTGYNGAPRNFPHPIDVGCLRDELNVPRGMVADICPCLHAEQNAIIQAATTGVSIDGADLYVTTQPCTQCSRLLANCGIKRVIFEEEYPDPLAVGILVTAGVELWRWDHASKQAAKVKGANTFEQAQDLIRKKWKAGQIAASPTPGAVISAEAVRKSALRQDRQSPASTSPASAPFPQRVPPEAGDDPKEPKARGVRELRDDPERAELIRKLARDRAERKRRALDEAGL